MIRIIFGVIGFLLFILSLMIGRSSKAEKPKRTCRNQYKDF